MPKALPHMLWSFVLLCSLGFYAFLGRDTAVLYGDAFGYYLYLPATFIYHNHQQIEKLPPGREISDFMRRCAAGTGEGRRSPKGYLVNQYTYGTALMELPAFAVAHSWEKLTGGAANGFSENYKRSIRILTMLYGAGGLWLVFRFLRRRFSPFVAHLTTALLLLGTNLFWFTLYQQGMAHVPLFFLFALLLHLTDRIHHPGSPPATFAALGLVAGLITVIRPLDGLCVLLPLLYSAGRPQPVRRKMQFLRQRWQQIALAILAFLAPIVPQLLYWKWLTGAFLYDSYGSGQTLDLLHPKLLAGLLGASNGWLFYTPLLFFAVAGLLRNRRLGALRLAIPVFLLLYTWSIYGWFVPNYPNGLGSRPMVDVYAIWALPLAAALEWILQLRTRLAKAGIALLALLFVAVNMSYSVQQALGIIRSEDTNYTYVLSKAFQYTLSYDDLITWDIGVRQPDQGRLSSAGPDKVMTVTDLNAADTLATDSAGNPFFRMADEYSPLLISVKGAALRAQSVRWIQCSGVFNPLTATVNPYEIPMLVFEAKRGDSTLAWYGIRINNKLGRMENPALKPAFLDFRSGFWGQASGFVPVPAGLRPEDELRLFIWNSAREPLGVKEIRMSFYR